jgi:hypothetical protein
MTQYGENNEYMTRRYLAYQPMLRLVSSQTIFVETPVDEIRVLRCAAKILLRYGQFLALGPDWQSWGTYWIPGPSRFRWLRKRWGYMYISTRSTMFSRVRVSMSLLFDAVSGKLLRFRYDDNREARWVWEMHQFGEIEGGLVERPDDCVYRDPSPGEDPVELFVAGVLRNNARRIAAGL